MTVGERLLTVKETAARLRLNPETIRRWLRQGRIRGTLMGSDRGGYRISESEIAKIAAEGPRRA
jgi:excisionase family DNA binding protein